MFGMLLEGCGKSILEVNLMKVNEKVERRTDLIYENVKALADKKKLSIAEVERRAGIGNGTIGKWQKATPNLKSLEAVAKVLGVSISRLMKGTK